RVLPLVSASIRIGGRGAGRRHGTFASQECMGRVWEDPLARRALITGITGQDGSYLAEYLLEQGYEVWGLVRGQANPRVSRVRRLLQDVRLVRGDLLDQGSLIAAVEKVRPDEVYNLGALSFVPMSWEQAELTAEVTGLGGPRRLAATRVWARGSGWRTADRGGE